MLRRLAFATIAAIAAATLAGCGNEYGYGGVAAGYGPPGYYGYDGYGPYGYADYYDGAYGAPYWGWYGGFYYPGTGFYVYDAYRRPYRWTGEQQRYWSARLSGWRGNRSGLAPQWRGFTAGQGQGRGATSQAFAANRPGGGQASYGYRASTGGGGFHGGGGARRGR